MPSSDNRLVLPPELREILEMFAQLKAKLAGPVVADQAQGRFEWVQPPSVLEISPMSAAPMERVVVRGTALQSAEVEIGGTRAHVEFRGRNEVRVLVPDAATGGPLSVHFPLWDLAIHNEKFTVTPSRTSGTGAARTRS